LAVLDSLKSRSSRTKGIALAVLGILFAGVIGGVVLSSGPTPTVKAEIGREIPEAERRMETPDGDVVTFDQFEGHTLVVNFWASWCRPCVREFPLFADALEGSDDLRIIGVIYDDSTAAARSFARRLGATWPSVIDSDGEVAAMFGVSTPPGIPQTFFIDQEGVLRRRIFGEMNKERLDEELSRTGREAS
jgi:cytochrome c biogenesis protein CcmG/thiol:disulfide interchange protein DsbE